MELTDILVVHKKMKRGIWYLSLKLHVLWQKEIITFFFKILITYLTEKDTERGEYKQGSEREKQTPH